jgi:hypothetical protein
MADATTTLTNAAHVLFMDRDGGNCRVGVRRLAEVTGLNKSTVAEHRSHAIELGWLIASSNSSRSVKREIVAAIPDTIATEHIKKLSGQTGQQVSGAAGQSQANSRQQLYGQDDSTVRFQPSNCPAPPDIPLIPLLPLRAPHSNVVAKVDHRGGDRLPLQTLKMLLQKWIRNDERARKYRHDAATLALLVPPDFRFPGYEDVIRSVVIELCRQPAIEFGR